MGRTQRGWFISAGEASLTRRASWCSWCCGSHLWKIEFPMKILLQTNHCYTFNKEPNSFVILFLNIIIFIIFKSLDSNSQWLELAFCMCLLWLGVISFSWLGCHRKEIKKDTRHSTQFEERCWMHWSQPRWRRAVLPAGCQPALHYTEQPGCSKSCGSRRQCDPVSQECSFPSSFLQAVIREVDVVLFASIITPHLAPYPLLPLIMS